MNQESRKACVQKSGEGGGNSRHEPVKVSGDGDGQEDAEPQAWLQVGLEMCGPSPAAQEILLRSQPVGKALGVQRK